MKFVVVCDKFNKGLSSIKVEDKFYSDSNPDYTHTRLLEGYNYCNRIN